MDFPNAFEQIMCVAKWENRVGYLLWLAGHIASLADLHGPPFVSSICRLRRGKVTIRDEYFFNLVTPKIKALRSFRNVANCSRVDAA